MNTNQTIETDTNSANPFASAILQSVFDKKPEVISEKSAETGLQTNESNAASDTVSQILSRLESKKEAAAVNLGIDAEKVETMPFDLSALETEGIFLNIDASGFGALYRRLDWKTLGVELPEDAAVRWIP